MPRILANIDHARRKDEVLTFDTEQLALNLAELLQRQ